MTIGKDLSHAAKNAYCVWCGSALVAQARFCPGCGEEVPTADGTASTSWFEQTSADDLRSMSEAPSSPEHNETLSLWEDRAHELDETSSPTIRERLRELLRGRALPVGAAALIVLLLLVVSAAAGYRHFRDAPAREAFADGQRRIAPIIDSLSEADDVEQLAMAGARANEAVENFRVYRDEAASVDSAIGRTVTAILDAELGLVQAGAKISALNEEDLSVWGDAHAAFVASLESLDSATSDLRREDQDLSVEVPATTDLMSNLESVVGTAVAASAEESLVKTLGGLASAETTADVRQVADGAAQEQQVLLGAAEGLPEDGETTGRLDTFAAVYGAVAGMSMLDGESLDQWSKMRRELTIALAATSPGSQVADAGRGAVRRLNDLVNRAETRLSDWQASYDAAVAKKSTDAAALDEYRSGMEAQMRIYSSLRADLSEWVARVDDPSNYVTYEEGYSVLSQAQWDRQVVREAMNGLAVPSMLQSSHSELVQVVDDAIAALQAAYDGTNDADMCRTSCYYRDTPGWQRFSAESGRITDAYRLADDAWHAAVSGAEAEITNRSLPRKPQV